MKTLQVQNMVGLRQPSSSEMVKSVGIFCVCRYKLSILIEERVGVLAGFRLPHV